MKTRLTAVAATCLLTFSSFQASPEDIDIFAVDESNLVARPNVLFVLDNSANWSRQSQQWPEAEDQGQSEVAAIRQVIQELDANVNIGLLEYITGGSQADQASGYVRYHIRPMTTENKAGLSNHLTKIYGDINTPEEKRAQANPFGNLFWDVYNYLASTAHSNSGLGTPGSLADDSAYQTPYSLFQSPLTLLDSCTRTVVIFIGNNVQSGPTPDSDANVKALYDLALAAGGDADAAKNATAQIPFAEYTVKVTPDDTELGFSGCFESQAACTSAINTTACTDEGFTSCFCDTTPSPISCTAPTHWTVTGTSYALGSQIGSPAVATEENQDAGAIVQQCKTSGQIGQVTPVCPAGTSATVHNSPQTGQSTKTDVTWADCKYVSLGTTGCETGGQTSNKENWQLQGKRVTTVTTYATDTTQKDLGSTNACYTDAATCSTSDFTACGDGTFNGGCVCSASDGTNTGCSGVTSRYIMKAKFNRIEAVPTGTERAAPAGPFMMDEWARFLRIYGVPVPGTDGKVRSQVTTYTVDVFRAQQDPDFSALLFNAARVGGGKYFQAKDKESLVKALRQILTEVQAVNSAFSSASLPVNATNRAQNENQVFIGVFKPDRDKKPLWFGNLKQYQLINTGTAIELGDKNKLPAINKETGFITDCAVSFWTTDSGNYWQFPTTTNPQPLGMCKSNDTSDLSDLPDGPFVEKGAVAEMLRKGNDPSATPDSYGNYEVNRNVLTRTATTAANATLPPFDTDPGTAPDLTPILGDTLIEFIRGLDVLNEDSLADPPDPDTGEVPKSAYTEPRSTIHGDVVHSRPQPLNYGGTTGVVVFYGANDGTYRAVKASTGQELWAFVAPEHYSRLDRLYKNGPPNRFFNDDPTTTDPKDYFFDGSTGVYQIFDDSGVATKTYIYPTMRRGGNRVYGLDVTNPATPKFLFSKGCDSFSCDTGYSDMAQTWSFPNVALIKGYSTSTPVLVMGAGYDGGYKLCEDENAMVPDLATCTKGKGVYVLDGVTGNRLAFFPTLRSVAADVALIDVNADKLVDYGYAVDTGGNVYRFDFVDGPATLNALAPANWTSKRVAYTNQNTNPTTSDQDPRKFLFAPALLQATASVVYLAVGTGDREHPLMTQYPFGTDGVPASAVLNRFYVFKNRLDCVDKLNETVSPAVAGTDGVCDGNATVPTVLNLDDTGAMADYSDTNACANADITPAHAKNGWFIDLNEHGQGEQVVTSAVIAGGFVFFSTNRPTPNTATACTNSLGEARGYFMNVLDASGAVGVTGACGGERSSTFVGGGLPPSPVLATVPIEGQLRTVVIGAVQKTGQPSSPIEAQRVRPPIASDRKPIYWYKSTGDK